jgi:pyruvate formate lyase activating enzyme
VPTRVASPYFTTRSGGEIQCHLCPRACILAEGERCFCRTRFNEGGVLFCDAYNVPAFFHVDPIEKGPLHHVLPGARAFALGTAGCNLRCMYCQNWQVSQAAPAQARHQVYTAQELVAAARRGLKTRFVAFTYTEPVAYLEYMLEIARAARDAGLRTNMVTALYINPRPLKDVCPLVDAFTVALKGFEETFFDKVLASRLKPVLEALKVIRGEGRWLELVTLLVPGYNDSADEVKRLSGWVARELGEEVPLHFARFWPAYKLTNLAQTPEETLFTAHATARAEGLRYVYVANLPGGHPANNTYCPSCRKAVVRRIGFDLSENLLDATGRCPCGTRIPGIWA